MDQLHIQSAQGPYKVFFHPRFSETKAALEAQKPTHFIIDRNVYQLHKSGLDELIAGRPTYFIDATEETKTIHGVEKFSTWLQQNQAFRSSVLVAIGGGITQDLAAFTSHVYYRGISWVFYPTTLLSMCDSSIGAKCGINLNEFKNQLGVFHAPKAIFTCSNFLETLPDFHVSSGYGEILKLFLTLNAWEMLPELEKALTRGLRNPELLTLIRKALEIKKQVIEADEFESDFRRVLNYGHSFGHSLESITNHEIPHGLAVAWGMDIINFIAHQRGLLDQQNYLRIKNLIKTHFPFYLSRKIGAEELINGARKDKKSDPSGINLVFLTNQGKLGIHKVPFDQSLQSQISQYLETENVYFMH